MLLTNPHTLGALPGLQLAVIEHEATATAAVSRGDVVAFDPVATTTVNGTVFPTPFSITEAAVADGDILFGVAKTDIAIGQQGVFYLQGCIDVSVLTAAANGAQLTIGITETGLDDQAADAAHKLLGIKVGTTTGAAVDKVLFSGVGWPVPQ